jgi:hypothetical protein
MIRVAIVLAVSALVLMSNYVEARPRLCDNECVKKPPPTTTPHPPQFQPPPPPPPPPPKR